MSTLLDFTYHQDPKSFRVNEIPARAYFIPFESAEKTRERRESSAFFTLLSGEWRYLWRPSLYEMEDFYISGFDLSDFETVSVPETWQAHGKDYIQYQSSPYPFVVDPPHVPEKNPCAAYVREFDASPVPGKRYELHFEGKDSCVYVWMNGTFVGYGEVPHNDSAFDVTPYLQNGTNRLAVLVLKWCSGTYLDDQDKIRLSGIFRDVYLLERSARGIRDFAIKTDVEGHLSLSVASDAPVTAEVYDGDTLLAGGTVGDGFSVTVDAPQLWSAESPYLYDLVLSCDGEYVRHRFGFREAAVKDGVFTVNRKHVKFYGVNRHDSNPETGYVTSVDFMRSELILMKQHNVNAVRTSHYPNDPRFYALCDELGIYVLSEADLECHGFTYLDCWNRLLNDPLYADMIHDRIVRMHSALKNFSSIVVWSLGNESSWGDNLRNESHYLREVDPSRPIHYEGALHDFLKKTEEEQRDAVASTDFISSMYHTFEKLKATFEHPLATKPLVLCEYSHALGNSCGDLRFYDDLFETSDRFTGGFIWEWCDHAMMLEDENGTRYFGYGGDFGEKHHLHDYCMDGTVAPDRRPHSALLEAKAVFAPIRVTQNEDGSLTVKNRNAFTDLSRYDLRFTVTVDGMETDVGLLSANPAPKESVTIPSPAAASYRARTAVLTVYVLMKDSTAWAEAGHTVTAFSFPLPTEKPEKIPAEGRPTLEETKKAFVISGKTESGKAFAYTFRKDVGLLTQISLDGEDLLKAPLALNCYRAATGNDRALSQNRNVHLAWTANRRIASSLSASKFGNIEYPELAFRNLTAALTDSEAVVSADFIFGAPGAKFISRGTITFHVDSRGVLTISQDAHINEELTYFLPRYGYVFALKSPAEAIRYFGYGPAESYEDKCSHALLGHHDYMQDDPRDAYEFPQECGSHTGTESLSLTSGNASLTFEGHFSFCASRYDLHNVSDAMHQKDLKLTDGTFLFVDHRMSGVGSASCGGQHPIPECRINAGEDVSHAVTLTLL